MKYAFPDGSEGEVRVEFKLLKERRYQLTISDNGIGLPPGFTWENSQSLGMQLVNLLTQQIDGTIQVAPTGSNVAGRPGTTFTVTFPADQK
jgi:two-component sensor histidine kinase